MPHHSHVVARVGKRQVCARATASGVKRPAHQRDVGTAVETDRRLVRLLHDGPAVEQDDVSEIYELEALTVERAVHDASPHEQECIVSHAPVNWGNNVGRVDADIEECCAATIGDAGTVVTAPRRRWTTLRWEWLMLPLNTLLAYDSPTILMPVDAERLPAPQILECTLAGLASP